MTLALMSITIRHIRCLTSLNHLSVGRHTRSQSMPIHQRSQMDGSSRMATGRLAPTQNGLRFFIVLIWPVLAFTSPDSLISALAPGYSASTTLKSTFKQVQHQRPPLVQQPLLPLE